MGFARLPSKVNARGIEVDRPAPFALIARTTLRVPAGPHRLILRAKGAARLSVDGRVVAQTGPIQPNAAGHEAVPEPAPPEDARWREVAAGDQERVVDWTSDGKAHEVELAAVLGARKLRPEPGEMSVSVAAPGEVPVLVGGRPDQTLTPEGWDAFAAAERARIDALDTARRRQAARSEDAFWKARHDLAAREAFAVFPPELPVDVFRPDPIGPIDRRIAEGLAKAGPPAESAGRRRLVPPPALARRDRPAADGRRGRGVPGRPPPRQAVPGHRRPAGRPPMGRLLDGLLAGRPGREPRDPQAHPEQHRAVPPLPPPGDPRRPAARPGRDRAGPDGRQQELYGGPGRVRAGDRERRADGRQGPHPGQGVPGRRHEVSPDATTPRRTRSTSRSSSPWRGCWAASRRRSRPPAR